MRILITTGIYPPEIGGPAQYALHTKGAFERMGCSVRVLTYSSVERTLPFGFRHIWTFLRALCVMPGTDLVIALDTISTGVPAVCAAVLFGKTSIVRIGGDFLWETFVERTHTPVTLPDFYQRPQPLSWKETAIFQLQKFLLRIVSRVVYTTQWQMSIWERPYGVPKEKCSIVENAYELRPESLGSLHPVSAEKSFLWAGRPVVLKNLPLLTQVFDEAREKGASVRLECVTGISHEDLMRKVRESYAVILPSFSDVSPNFILDGLKAGKPFIVTKHTGIADRLSDAGFFVDPEDKKDILKAVLALCDESTYEARRSALTKLSYVHTYDDIAKEFLSIASPSSHVS